VNYSVEIQQTESLLTPYRVLDLTDERGYLCGQILGDLGADVIKIEPPGGDPGRRIGPFYHDIPDPEKSLFWFAYNTNKRGITLNIETADGREIFKRLVKTADFVIESFPPGYMDRLGLGYSLLSQINPRIIMTSITPFGQEGPYKDYKAADIVLMAMSGLMYLTGDPDRPPVRVSFPQAYLHASAEAAVGTMIAHHHRELTGEGQWVDASAQESVIEPTGLALWHWDMHRENLQRLGPWRGGLSMGGKQKLLWECKDGHMSYSIYGGHTGAPANRALIKWMDEEGMAPDFLKEKDWENFDITKASQAELDQISEPIGRFFLEHTKEEIYEEAIRRRLFIDPVATISDLLENPQLSARAFWQEVDHPELGTAITYPGAFVRLSEASCRIRHRAPLIGEHNEEIYKKELGLSKEELVILKQAGVI
jgi:crotonobetainyl-CoA:carnitine CoA-transferase CaiB-like acyl-CoA transferase